MFLAHRRIYFFFLVFTIDCDHDEQKTQDYFELHGESPVCTCTHMIELLMYGHFSWLMVQLCVCSSNVFVLRTKIIAALHAPFV